MGSDPIKPLGKRRNCAREPGTNDRRMARLQRAESPDAIFHVYSRGNYRTDIFEESGASGSFLNSVHEVTLRAGWHLYTFAVMPNHFHLMLRTPRANLARGMHLLLSGFAIRFNGLRDERGHVFQGRYHAKKMPGSLSAGRLFDYINLNPVRKGLVSVDALSKYDFSGVRGLCHPLLRGECRQGEALERFIGYPDGPDGWANYIVHLKRVCAEDPDAVIFDYEWAKAETEERRQMPKTPLGAGGLAGVDTAAMLALELRHTEDTFEKLLLQIGKSSVDIDREFGVRPWKLSVAAQMFRLTTAPMPWVVQRLNGGSVSNFTLRLRNGVRPY